MNLQRPETVISDPLREILKDDPMKAEMGIHKESILLLISTEGDTDPEGYERILNR